MISNRVHYCTLAQLSSRLPLFSLYFALRSALPTFYLTAFSVALIRRQKNEERSSISGIADQRFVSFPFYLFFFFLSRNKIRQNYASRELFPLLRFKIALNFFFSLRGLVKNIREIYRRIVDHKGVRVQARTSRDKILTTLNKMYTCSEKGASEGLNARFNENNPSL